MRTIRRLLLRLAAISTLAGLSTAIGFGYLGAIHPAFDAFAHLRLHFAAALAIGLVPLAMLRFRPEAAIALAVCVLAFATTLGWYTDRAEQQVQAQGPVFRLMHMNLRFDNDRPELVLSAIGAHRPDVLTLNEVSDVWAERLELIQAAYPYRLICPQPSHIGGAAILSRRPFAREPEGCGDRGSFASVDIDFAGRVATVATLHLGWPWPFSQPWHLDRLKREEAPVSDAMLLAGDFNAVPWSHAVRRVEAWAELRAVSGIGPTWLDRRLPDAWRPWVGLPIDNLLADDGVSIRTARTLEAVGSDHLPILVEFTVEAGARPAVDLAGR